MNFSGTDRKVALTPEQYRAGRTIVIVSALPSLVLSFWWWWHFSGLYLWLANVQLGWWKSYDVNMTGLYTFLITFLVILLPPALLHKLVYGRDSISVTPTTVTTAIRPTDMLSRSRDITTLIQQNRYTFAFTCIGLVGVIAGAYYTILGYTAGAHTTVAPEDFALDRPIATHYISISGTPDTDDTVYVEEERSKTYYVPLFTGEEDLALFIKSKDKTKLDSGKEFTGVLSRHLDGLVREEFKRIGIPAQDTSWVLDVDTTPESQRSMGIAFLISGSVGALIFGKRFQNKLNDFKQSQQQV